VRTPLKDDDTEDTNSIKRDVLEAELAGWDPLNNEALLNIEKELEDGNGLQIYTEE
jgi:hypothetical protein